MVLLPKCQAGGFFMVSKTVQLSMGPRPLQSTSSHSGVCKRVSFFPALHSGFPPTLPPEDKNTYICFFSCRSGSLLLTHRLFENVSP